MYRTREERERQWEEQGGRPTKADWFRKGGFTSVLNVPTTPGSELAGRVEEVLRSVPGPTGCRPRVQERPGRSVLAQLTTNTTFPRESCGRKYCPWVARGEACWERCFRENICYVAFCLKCRQRQQQQNPGQTSHTEGAYLGESSRSIVFRIESHFKIYKQSMNKQRRGGVSNPGEASEETSSFMADHMRDEHGGQASNNPFDDFEFHLLATYKKVLERLVAESVWIEWAKAKGVVKVGPTRTKVFKELLNRQGEFYHFNPRGWRPGPGGRGPGL